MDALINALTRFTAQAAKNNEESENRITRLAEELATTQANFSEEIQTLIATIKERNSNNAQGGNKKGIDFRTLMKPTEFKGGVDKLRTDWKEWSFKYEVWIRAQYPEAEKIIQEVKEKKNRIDRTAREEMAQNSSLDVTDIENLSAQMHASLIGFCQDEAFETIRNIEEKCGLEAHRKLYSTYDPKDERYDVELQDQIDKVTSTKMNEFRRAVEIWESDVRRWTQRTGRALEDGTKRTRLFQLTPEEMKKWVDENLRNYPTYEELKTELFAQVDRALQRNKQGASQYKPINTMFKGKGKPDGSEGKQGYKGKGKQLHKSWCRYHQEYVAHAEHECSLNPHKGKNTFKGYSKGSYKGDPKAYGKSKSKGKGYNTYGKAYQNEYEEEYGDYDQDNDTHHHDYQDQYSHHQQPEEEFENEYYLENYAMTLAEHQMPASDRTHHDECECDNYDDDERATVAQLRERKVDNSSKPKCSTTVTRASMRHLHTEISRALYANMRTESDDEYKTTAANQRDQLKALGDNQGNDPRFNANLRAGMKIREAKRNKSRRERAKEHRETLRRNPQPQQAERKRLNDIDEIERLEKVRSSWTQDESKKDKVPMPRRSKEEEKEAESQATNHEKTKRKRSTNDHQKQRKKEKKRLRRQRKAQLRDTARKDSSETDESFTGLSLSNDTEPEPMYANEEEQTQYSRSHFAYDPGHCHWDNKGYDDYYHEDTPHPGGDGHIYTQSDWETAGRRRKIPTPQKSTYRAARVAPKSNKTEQTKGEFIDLVVDSGSSDHAMPEEFAEEYPMEETSKKIFITASKHKMESTTAKAPVFQLQGGTGGKRKIKLRLMPVSRPLLSVSKLEDNQYKTVFGGDRGASYIYHTHTGDWWPLRRERGLYILRARVTPPEIRQDPIGRAGVLEEIENSVSIGQDYQP